MWEHPLQLHPKTTPFYTRNLSIHGFWYLWVQGSQTQSPKGTEERGQGLLRTSATPPALDTVSSTVAQLLTCFSPQFLCQASLTLMSEITASSNSHAIFKSRAIRLLYFCF
uniref:Uncharacterized protein n=1 Tax=Bos indicus x Bos taurus TaxID=30522 RepID=A0A4W2BMQ6_BOBOX